MAVSKRLRYEVFRRDNHACRYCGAAAPDAKLTIDHVVPIALGGTDDPANLVTACSDCNSGKSASTPDAPIVEDISADAIRWGNAMKEAASILLDGTQKRTDEQDRFADMWNQWGYGPAGNRQTVPLGPGWRGSVDSFLAAGLTMPILSECIDLAMNARHIGTETKFRYMCGIAWNKVAQLREIAAGLVGAQEDPPGEAPASAGPVCGCGCGRPWTGWSDPHPPPAEVAPALDHIRRRLT